MYQHDPYNLYVEYVVLMDGEIKHSGTARTSDIFQMKYQSQEIQKAAREPGRILVVIDNPTRERPTRKVAKTRPMYYGCEGFDLKFKTVEELAKYFGVSAVQAGRNLNGMTKRCKGRKFYKVMR